MKTFLSQLWNIPKNLARIAEASERPYPKVSAWLDTKPNSNHALFKALSDAALAETVQIVKSEMSSAMVFDHTDKFLHYCLNKSTPQGAHAEFGVYSGRSINLLAKWRKDVIFDGFDSFRGLPEEWDGWQVLDFDRKGTPPAVEENVHLHIGLFDETLPDYANGVSDVSFLHVDCDLYSSTKTIFEHLRHAIKPGTVIVFDEYFCYPGFEMHERKAFWEFLEGGPLTPQWIAVCGQRAACIMR